MSTELIQLIAKLKSLNIDYKGVGIIEAMTPGKWPFDSAAEVQLRRDANRICGEIMRTERQIIEELLK